MLKSVMENQTINKFQKRKNEVPADDSFDFFLPNKLREKPKIINKAGHSRRNNNTLAKRKQNSSSSSSSSQEASDKEVDRILEMCLSKDNNTSTKAGTKRTDSISDWNKIKGKMKRQPLLMTRTLEERESILSQKLALILLTNEVDDGDKYSKIDLDNLVNSGLLLQQCCKACRLWSAAREPFTKTNEFYLVALSNYIEINEKSLEPVNLPVANEVLAVKTPPQHEVTVNNSDLDIFECDNRVEEKPFGVNVSSSENKDINLEDHLIEQYTSVISAKPSVYFSSYNVTNKTAPNKEEELINISSSSSPSPLPSIKSVQESSGAYNISEDSQKTISPCNSPISLGEEVEQIRMLDRMGVTLLAEQWDDLFNTDNGDITVLLSLGASLKVHKFVLTVRCQPLVPEISEDCKLEWSAYTLEAAKAFFRYVYSGKCDHLWHLAFLDKVTVKLLSHLYKLNHLEEVLIKFHYLRCSSQSEVTEGINQSTERKLEVSYLEYSSQIPSTFIKTNAASESVKRREELVTPVDSDKTKKSPVQSEKFSISPRFRSPPNLQENFSSPEISRGNYEPVRKKRSLEKYFQDSFPDFTSTYGDLDSTAISSNTDFTFSTFHGIPATTLNTLKDEEFEHPISPIIENISITSSPVLQDEKLEYSLSSPNIETLSSRSSKSSIVSFSSHDSRQSQTSENFVPSTQLITPSTSTGIIFSKSATPFPDYDSMITPQIKRELKKFGLRSDLGANKAKVLLKYIYEQTHPIVESKMENKETLSSQVTISSSSENAETLKEIISRLIKQNKMLYTHTLLFRPIWFEDFFELLKENGIICSKNELKDTLNDLCVTYRTKNVGNTNLKKKSRKRKKL